MLAIKKKPASNRLIRIENIRKKMELLEGRGKGL